MAKRPRNPEDSLRLVIVNDMWLTGFDAPCMHTMYVDKPMRGHGLMQAIARVNHVFRDKPGGLVVDYIGIAQNLKNALSQYSDADRDPTGIDEEQGVALLAVSLMSCATCSRVMITARALPGLPKSVSEPLAMEWIGSSDNKHRPHGGNLQNLTKGKNSRAFRMQRLS